MRKNLDGDADHAALADWRPLDLDVSHLRIAGVDRRRGHCEQPSAHRPRRLDVIDLTPWHSPLGPLISKNREARSRLRRSRFVAGQHSLFSIIFSISSVLHTFAPLQPKKF